MATVSDSTNSVRDLWLGRLDELLRSVASWAKGLGWESRAIKKRMEDKEIGSYEAPALVLQQDAIRVMVEPIARTAEGAEGVVDIYLMPAYDDIASMYFLDGVWQLHYMFPDAPTVPTIRDAESCPLTKETLANVFDAMKCQAV